jgi:putative transcriptional regulator
MQALDYTHRHPPRHPVRPTQYKVGQVAGSSFLHPEFAACPLYLGGDVGPESVHLVHGVCGLAESVEVVRGVHMGGFTAAKAGLAEGIYVPEQFKVCGGWGGVVHEHV